MQGQKMVRRCLAPTSVEGIADLLSTVYYTVNYLKKYNRRPKAESNGSVIKADGTLMPVSLVKVIPRWEI